MASPSLKLPIVILFLALSICCLNAKPGPVGTFGICLEACNLNNLGCPDGYECQSNGCGHHCVKPKPSTCDPFMCGVPCENGYRSDAAGCLICECL